MPLGRFSWDYQEIQMAGKLTFNVGEVRVLIAHAKTASSHNPSYEDLFNPAFHKGGKVKMVNDWPDADNLDSTKIPVGLHLVKDQGVYLMSNGEPRLLKPGSESSVVSYAAEANPETGDFNDWYDAAASIMGGDDCVISLPISMFEIAIKDKSDKDTFKLKVTTRTVSLVK